MAQPFSSWASPGNAWNGTFITLSGGTFFFQEMEFSNIHVADFVDPSDSSGGVSPSTFIRAVVNDGKSFTFDRCVVTACGCLGNGDSIRVTSPTASGEGHLPSSSLSVENSQFRSCFANEGGVFSLDIPSAVFTSCNFEGNKAKGRGGCIHGIVNATCILELNTCIFDACSSEGITTPEGGAIYVKLCNNGRFLVGTSSTVGFTNCKAVNISGDGSKAGYGGGIYLDFADEFVCLTGTSEFVFGPSISFTGCDAPYGKDIFINSGNLDCGESCVSSDGMTCSKCPDFYKANSKGVCEIILTCTERYYLILFFFLIFIYFYLFIILY
jgi:hypothetical protein